MQSMILMRAQLNCRKVLIFVGHSAGGSNEAE